MARAGIALYVNPDIPGDAGAGLGDLMSWKTRAVHVKTIALGETVSYGRRFTAEHPTRVMTLPVGYADGYHRAIGGKGRALVRGQSAPVIGRVCMDQTMLDVTDIPGAKVGDEVVLLGQQGTERITAREMGTWCGMIDYEIVLSPTGRVPRVYR
jgi:alanine racemase